ncbi:MAG TPA: SIR2 family protein [Phycisphaerales bacterium]|nr:SIR2 family protein [Phycisphaerales bacterium]
MRIELHPKTALLNAALMTKRPVAFLVGSPLSSKDGVGVPDITAMLDVARDEVRARAHTVLPQFEAAIAGKDGSDAYQAAMKWIGVNGGQDAVNDVIAKAVLQARKVGAANVTAGTDGEPGDWSITPGTVGIADLVARGGDKFLGPILTTNFDPLLSLAIRAQGGRAGRRVLTADGTLAGAAEDEPGVCSVVHLHGFWRDSDTLHTQAQLTNPRPKLKASLQRLLVAQQRTLVVAAYGGWDDVFTSALVELMNDEQAKLDVIWCFYESDSAKVEDKYGKLLKTVAPAMVLNRFRCFGGIDCHSIFAEIQAAVRGATSPAVASATSAAPLAGWELIDTTYLDSLTALNTGDLVRYFDGAVPTWRHAASSDIPRRQAVEEIAKRSATLQVGNGSCSMQLIRAAGGEGKTTLLLQSAHDAVRSGYWTVLWRPSPHVKLLPEHVVNLDTTRQWLLVADDAESMIVDLEDCARRLHAAGRSNVHFLLATRDTDWWNKGGDSPTWESWLKAWVRKQQAIVLRGISQNDAERVVNAWAKCGHRGLGELAKLPNSRTQVKALKNAVERAVGEQDNQHRGRQVVEGSFFGGLLDVRFGPPGLQAHVRTFLDRLRLVSIGASDQTLFSALVYVSACHALGVPGLDARVLADLVGVPRDWVHSRVVRPLGEEASAVESDGYVFTRHKKVAVAVLLEAEESLGLDLSEVFSSLIRQTISSDRENRLWMRWFSSIVLSGPRIGDALPSQIAGPRRNVIAIAAAIAATRHKSEWLGCVVSLGKTYRLANEPCNAAKVFRDNLPNASAKVDYDKVIRGYWYEWGLCEGLTSDISSHRAPDAWLQGLSLSDHLNPAPITPEQARLGFAGLGIAFGKVAQPTPKCAYAKARRAVAYLGRHVGDDPKGMEYFDRYDREANKIKTPYPRDILEAVSWLNIGVTQAGGELQDPFLSSLLKPERVSFDALRRMLAPSRLSETARAERTTIRDLERIPETEPLPEGELRVAVERIAHESWALAPNTVSSENRLKIARREAVRLIGSLASPLRDEVENHFVSHGWRPLMARIPKA